jgi:hypothetical protein
MARDSMLVRSVPRAEYEDLDGREGHRLQHAKELLTRTPMSITEVVLAAGFSFGGAKRSLSAMIALGRMSCCSNPCRQPAFALTESRSRPRPDGLQTLLSGNPSSVRDES